MHMSAIFQACIYLILLWRTDWDKQAELVSVSYCDLRAMTTIYKCLVYTVAKIRVGSISSGYCYLLIFFLQTLNVRNIFPSICPLPRLALNYLRAVEMI